jgi:hypothetical protein
MRAPFSGDVWLGFSPGTQSEKLYSLPLKRTIFHAELFAFGSPDYIDAGCDVRPHECYSSVEQQ